MAKLAKRDKLFAIQSTNYNKLNVELRNLLVWSFFFCGGLWGIFIEKVVTVACFGKGASSQFFFEIVRSFFLQFSLNIVPLK